MDRPFIRDNRIAESRRLIFHEELQRPRLSSLTPVIAVENARARARDLASDLLREENNLRSSPPFLLLGALGALAPNAKCDCFSHTPATQFRVAYRVFVARFPRRNVGDIMKSHEDARALVTLNAQAPPAGESSADYCAMRARVQAGRIRRCGSLRVSWLANNLHNTRIFIRQRARVYRTTDTVRRMHVASI